MATYTTIEEVQANIPGLEVDNTVESEKLLDQAERDIDQRLGTYKRDATTGRKIDTTLIAAYQVDALKRAVAYQFEYRIRMGSEFFALPQPEKATGPGVEYEGRLPILGPAAVRELESADLYRLTGRVWAGRSSEFVDTDYYGTPEYRVWRTA